MKLLKNKSGNGVWIIISFVLIGAAIILFFLPFSLEAGKLIKSGDSAACSLSLLGGEGTAKCPIDKIDIYIDRVEINDKKSIGVGKAGTQTMAKKEIAQLLKSCLSRGGGYNSKSFSRENYFPDEVVCLQCSEINIDQSVGNIDGLTDYLRDTKVTATDKTYLNALTRDPEHLEAYMQYGMARNLAPSTGSFIFKPDKDYIVFFMGIKKGEIKNIWEKIKDVANAEFLILFFGNNDAYFTYIVESNRLNEACDRLVN